jgi:lysine/ornithine N-monooxygenase
MVTNRSNVVNAIRSRPSGTAGQPDVDVAVIGAGPHGLSAAVHLRRAGVDAQVFGDPMSFWRGMPKGMSLRSNMSATNLVEPVGPLSLLSYMEEKGVQFGHPVSLRRFIDYGLWVQRNGVPDVDRRRVEHVERAAGGGFLVDLEGGARVSAARVVVACGIEPFARRPDGFDHLPSELVSHTGDHDDPAVFASKRVVVVGGGQSALESAVLMSERAAEVEVVARAPETVWLRSWSPIHFMGRLGKIVYAPTDVGPLWYSRLVATPALFTRLPRETQDRIAQRSIRPACSYFVKVRVDGITLSAGTQVTDAQEHGSALRLSLSDGTTREVDHLMFGTGYKVDVSRYPFLGAGILDAMKVIDGYPVLRRGLETSVSGLHMMGAPAARSVGPTMRFVSGSWYGGSRVAASIAGHSRRPMWQPAPRREAPAPPVEAALAEK